MERREEKIKVSGGEKGPMCPPARELPDPKTGVRRGLLLGERANGKNAGMTWGREKKLKGGSKKKIKLSGMAEGNRKGGKYFHSRKESELGAVGPEELNDDRKLKRDSDDRQLKGGRGKDSLQKNSSGWLKDQNYDLKGGSGKDTTKETSLES